MAAPMIIPADLALSRIWRVHAELIIDAENAEYNSHIAPGPGDDPNPGDRWLALRLVTELLETLAYNVRDGDLTLARCTFCERVHLLPFEELCAGEEDG